MSQILLREFENGSEVKANGAINGHRVGRKARDTRGRFQKIGSAHSNARPLANRPRRKRGDAANRRPAARKVWRLPARDWFSSETRDRLLVTLLLGAPAVNMGVAFMRGLLG
jgi:hypothetical protein